MLISLQVKEMWICVWVVGQSSVVYICHRSLSHGHGGSASFTPLKATMRHPFVRNPGAGARWEGASSVILSAFPRRCSNTDSPSSVWTWQLAHVRAQTSRWRSSRGRQARRKLFGALKACCGLEAVWTSSCRTDLPVHIFCSFLLVDL